MAHRYEAFLSYSHALDLELARELKRGLERFAKPRTEPRTMLVFRDEEDLAATPALWQKLEDAVEDSGALVLLASPESAASPGVLHELRTWFERVEEAPRCTFIVLTRGRIVEGENERIDWTRTDALPESLARHFEHVPRYLSAPEPSERRLRWRDPRVLELIADLSAAIQDAPKETLWSSECVSSAGAGAGMRGWWPCSRC